MKWKTFKYSATTATTAKHLQRDLINFDCKKIK